MFGVLTSGAVPVHHHSSLRKCKGEKCTHRVERNQTISDSAKHDEQCAGQNGQRVDPLGKYQAASAKHEGLGQIPVLRDGTSKTGKIRKGSVGRQREHNQDRNDADPVENAAPGHSRQQLREHALVTGQAGIGRRDAVGRNQIGDAEKHQHQNRNDDRQGPLGVLVGGLVKSHDSIADRFHSRHRGATAGEGAQKQPCADGSRDRGQFWGHDHRNRMASCGQGFDQANEDEREQAGDENVGRQQENAAGFLQAAQIDHRNDDQNRETQLQGVALQGWNGRNQRAHASRDSHCGGENVVDHQCRRCQQSCAFTQIFGGDRIGSATLRVRCDGLAVGEIDDAQQPDDCNGDRPHVGCPGHAERNQQRERGFGPVSSRTECVESEDGNAFDRTNALRFFFLGGEGAAEQ